MLFIPRTAESTSPRYPVGGHKMDEEKRLMENHPIDSKKSYGDYKVTDRIAVKTGVDDRDGDDQRPNELVYFNVSGRQFLTTSHTLYNFPNSLIGTTEKRSKLKHTRNGEIFFDRHPAVFECLLTFYQTGILEPPMYVSQNIFVADMKFFQLIDEAIVSGLSGFEIKKVPMPKRKVQAYLWKLLEYPDSSFLARIVSMFSLLVIIMSIVSFCWETIPEYRGKNLSLGKQLTVEILNDVEIFCIAYFTFEIIIRFLCAPQKLAFAKDFLNIIDLVSVLPFYITHIFTISGSVSIYFLRAIRLVRVFRVFKLSRHSNEMKILGIAVKDSGRELCVLLFFILLGVLLFSSAVYYAEDGAKDTKLTSIPGAFWWSVVTMTTVGYGDEVPTTIPGRIVGAVCAMTGILVIAMPIPIIVNNFTRQYQRLKPVSKFWEEFQERALLEQEKRRKDNDVIIGLYNLVDLNQNNHFHQNDVLIPAIPNTDLTRCGMTKNADSPDYGITKIADSSDCGGINRHHNHLFGDDGFTNVGDKADEIAENGMAIMNTTL